VPKVVEVPDRVRVMSVSVAEDEWKKIGTRLTEGLYAAWNYLQSLGGERNKRFVGAFKRRFGMDRVTDDPIEAAYFQVHLFAKARSTDARAIRHAARGLAFDAPGGRSASTPRISTRGTWPGSGRS
jgi:urea transport system substrate-binding protein